jgi:hypothetical protein
MPNAAVARTCTSIAVWKLPSRRMPSLLPGCGPAAVTSVPLITIETQAAPKRAAPARSQPGTSGATRPRSSPTASSSSTTPAVSTTRESRKCESTSQGSRS